LLNKKLEGVILESIRGVKERYAIEVSHVGFDQNHIHLLVRFLPKYSGGQVIRLLKSISAKAVFREIPEVKAELWGGEFWTDGYYISTISGKGNKAVIEKYIQNQGREKDIEQLKLFEI
jgi:putative transposase